MATWRKVSEKERAERRNRKAAGAKPKSRIKKSPPKKRGKKSGNPARRVNLGSGMASRAKKNIVNRRKRIDDAVRKGGG